MPEATHRYKGRPCYYHTKRKMWYHKGLKRFADVFEVHFIDGKSPPTMCVKPSEFLNTAFQKHIPLPKTQKALQDLMTAFSKKKKGNAK